MTLRAVVAIVAVVGTLHYLRRAPVQLTRNFTLGEFMRSSVPPVLTPAQERDALFYAKLLQPARDEFGAIAVTSFVRLTGAHAAGAVDVQLVDGSNADIKRLADWLAAHYLPSGQLAQVIYEPPEPGQHRAHVHITAQLVPGARPGYLVESIAAGRRIYTPQAIPTLV